MASFFVVVNLRQTKGHTIHTAIHTKLATSWHKCQYFAFKLSTMVYRVHKSTSVALIHAAISLYLVLPRKHCEMSRCQFSVTDGTGRCRFSVILTGTLLIPVLDFYNWFEACSLSQEQRATRADIETYDNRGGWPVSIQTDGHTAINREEGQTKTKTNRQEDIHQSNSLHKLC